MALSKPEARSRRLFLRLLKPDERRKFKKDGYIWAMRRSYYFGRIYCKIYPYSTGADIKHAFYSFTYSHQGLLLWNRHVCIENGLFQDITSHDRAAQVYLFMTGIRTPFGRYVNPLGSTVPVVRPDAALKDIIKIESELINRGKHGSSGKTKKHRGTR